MKKSICIVGVLCMMIVLNGCKNGEGDDLNDVSENMTEKEVMNEQIKSNDVKEFDEEELSARLGEVTNVDNQESQNIQEETLTSCEEGFIYHTELKECFEVGNAESKNDQIEIDPVVQECVDKGGIYNAQIEKCFY